MKTCLVPRFFLAFAAACVASCFLNSQAYADPYAKNYGPVPGQPTPWYGSGTAWGDNDLRTFELHWAPDPPPSNTELFRLQMPSLQMKGCQIDVNNFILQNANFEALRNVVSKLPATAGFASLYLMKHLPKVGSTIDELQRMGAMIASFQMADCQQMAQFAALKLSQEANGSSSPFLQTYGKRLECVARKGEAADTGACSDPSKLEEWWRKLGIPGALTADQAMQKIAGTVWVNWGRKFWPLESSRAAGQDQQVAIERETRLLRSCLTREFTATVERITNNRSISGPGGARPELEKLYQTPGGGSVGLSLTLYGATNSLGMDTPLMPGGICDGAFADAREIPLGSLAFYSALMCRANRETPNPDFDRSCFLAKDTVAQHLANFVALKRTQAVLLAANRGRALPEAQDQSAPEEIPQLQPGAREELEKLVQTVREQVTTLEHTHGDLKEFPDKFRTVLVQLLDLAAAYDRTKKAWVIEQVRYGGIRPVDALLESRRTDPDDPPAAPSPTPASPDNP